MISDWLLVRNTNNGVVLSVEDWRWQKGESG